jgi:hypothetical protein
MYAAADGKSIIGIPKDVGKEFVKADSGGELPERKTSKQSADSRYTKK